MFEEYVIKGLEDCNELGVLELCEYQGNTVRVSGEYCESVGGYTT